MFYTYKMFIQKNIFSLDCLRPLKATYTLYMYPVFSNSPPHHFSWYQSFRFMTQNLCIKMTTLDNYFSKIRNHFENCNNIKLHQYQVHADSHSLKAKQTHLIHVRVIKEIYTINKPLILFYKGPVHYGLKVSKQKTNILE